MFRTEKYEAYLSTVTLENNKDHPEPKRSQLLDYLEQINYTLFQINNNVAEIAANRPF